MFYDELIIELNKKNTLIVMCVNYFATAAAVGEPAKQQDQGGLYAILSPLSNGLEFILK